MTANPDCPNENHYLNNSLFPTVLKSKVSEAKLRGDISYVLFSSGKPITGFQWQAQISLRDSIAKPYKDFLVKEVT
jgi:hypothetical protein